MKSFTLISTIPLLMAASISFASCTSLSGKSALSTDDSKIKDHCHGRTQDSGITSGVASDCILSASSTDTDTPGLLITGPEMKLLPQDRKLDIRFTPTGTINRGISLAVFHIDTGPHVDQQKLRQPGSLKKENDSKQEPRESIIKNQIKANLTLRF